MSVLLTVSYRINGDVAAFRAHAPTVAARIAAWPGLRWKVWGLGPDGAGLSAYLFDTAEAAMGFAEGPILAGLRASPAVEAVTVAWAPVDAELSELTGFAA